jgi:hypothetical protein
MVRWTFILILFSASPAFSQTKINWKTFGDVDWTDKYSEEEDVYYYYPNFGPSVKELEGTEVVLKGFMLILGTEEKIYILSRYPYASCFFCGAAGPDSIVQLKLKPGHPKFKIDQRVSIKGKLKLNRDDFDQCNFILTDAEPFKR